MPLKNYTTKLDVSAIVGRIQAALVRAGARSILTDYDEHGSPTMLRFMLPTPYGQQGFQLPARGDRVRAVLLRQSKTTHIEARYLTAAHAQAVAWRNVGDWIEAQIALLETEMVTADEILLPYRTEEDGRTLYEVMVDRGGNLLPERATGGA